MHEPPSVNPITWYVARCPRRFRLTTWVFPTICRTSEEETPCKPNFLSLSSSIKSAEFTGLDIVKFCRYSHTTR